MGMQNRFQGLNGITGPATNAFAITPADGQGLSYITRGLYLGTAGNVSVVLFSGDAVIFKNLAAGIIHPLRVRQVLATNTTAQDIIGVY